MDRDWVFKYLRLRNFSLGFHGDQVSRHGKLEISGLFTLNDEDPLKNTPHFYEKKIDQNKKTGFIFIYMEIVREIFH